VILAFASCFQGVSAHGKNLQKDSQNGLTGVGMGQ
jgi:hypothetical protein